MKYNLVVSYLDYELRMMVFAKCNREINLVYDQKITNENIYKYDNDGLIDSLKQKINNVLNYLLEHFQGLNKKINIIVENEKMLRSSETKSLRIQIPFNQKHVVEQEDLLKFDSEAYARVNQVDNRVYGGYCIESLYLDSKQCHYPVGQVSKHNIEALGSAQFIDKHIYDMFVELFKDSGFEIKGFILGDYLLKRGLHWDNNNGIIEMNRKTTKFYMKHDDITKTISTPIGLVNLFNNVYDTLCETHNQKDSYAAVEFLKQHFTFKTIEDTYFVNNEITYNDATNVFRNVILNYFSYFKKELSKSGYNIDRFKLIVDGYDAKEMSSLLTTNQIINCEDVSLSTEKNSNDIKIKGQFINLDITQFKAMVAIQDLINYRYWELK